MNEKFIIVWEIITLGGFLYAGIYVLTDLLVEFIKHRNYEKLKKGERK